MKPTIQELGKAIETLTQYNLWRRDDNVPNSQEMPNPKDIGLAIEVSLKALKFALALEKPSDEVLMAMKYAILNLPFGHEKNREHALNAATDQALEELELEGRGGSVSFIYIDESALDDSGVYDEPEDLCTKDLRFMKQNVRKEVNDGE